MARKTLADLMAAPSDVDRAKIKATTQEDIFRHMVEDGDGAAVEPDTIVQEVLPPTMVRTQLGLSQADFATVLRVPVGTVRNWEQGRTLPDPAARSLLNAVARAPEAVLVALCPERRAEWIALGGRLAEARLARRDDQEREAEVVALRRAAG